ncbi:MAG: hypothetical protein HXS48_04340 [Theionarchaea archaeon]|nr:MAG: hypothetical protein AYK19_07715 [Theionarchaea archaeon DG-70-1]MBU7026151.1 hypothetical protein [Theionarchaea archaeon]
MSQTQVLFIWQPNERLKEYLTNGLRDLPVQLLFPPDATEDTYVELAPHADIIVGWRPTKELLYAATKLSLFINPGAGVQHLIDLFREVNQTKPVTLVNGHGNAFFTAQHAVALLLALMNRVIPHHDWMVKGEWRKGDQDAISIPLRDRNVGFLGYGHVNRNVHRFLSGFDVTFSAIRMDWNKQKGVLPTHVKKYTYSDLHPFLEEVDTMIISVPLTSLTKGMIKKKELELLGPESLLVNVGRGPVVDEYSLYTALKEKTICGAALDVWYNYTPDSDEKGRKYPFSYPFHTLDNVVLSPHRAASPLNDLHRWDEVIENIRRFAQGEREFINTVDLNQEY